MTLSRMSVRFADGALANPAAQESRLFFNRLQEALRLEAKRKNSSLNEEEVQSLKTIMDEIGRKKAWRIWFFGLLYAVLQKEHSLREIDLLDGDFFAGATIKFTNFFREPTLNVRFSVLDQLSGLLIRDESNHQADSLATQVWLITQRHARFVARIGWEIDSKRGLPVNENSPNLALGLSRYLYHSKVVLPPIPRFNEFRRSFVGSTLISIVNGIARFFGGKRVFNPGVSLRSVKAMNEIQEKISQPAAQRTMLATLSKKGFPRGLKDCYSTLKLQPPSDLSEDAPKIEGLKGVYKTLVATLQEDLEFIRVLLDQAGLKALEGARLERYLNALKRPPEFEVDPESSFKLLKAVSKFIQSKRKALLNLVVAKQKADMERTQDPLSDNHSLDGTQDAFSEALDMTQPTELHAHERFKVGLGVSEQLTVEFSSEKLNDWLLAVAQKYQVISARPQSQEADITLQHEEPVRGQNHETPSGAIAPVVDGTRSLSPHSSTHSAVSASTESPSSSTQSDEEQTVEASVEAGSSHATVVASLVAAPPGAAHQVGGNSSRQVGFSPSEHSIGAGLPFSPTAALGAVVSRGADRSQGGVGLAQSTPTPDRTRSLSPSFLSVSPVADGTAAAASGAHSSSSSPQGAPSVARALFNG